MNASSYKTIFGFDSYSHSFLPVGKPRPGFSFLILDEKNNPIAENNRSGALFMDSLFISSGYHENPEETGRVFPVIGGKRLYNTGDLALRLPSGDYLVLGRSEDRQVQIYGQRVELSEIENLLNNHPSVQRAFVVDVEIEDWHGIFSYIQPIPNEPGLSVSESSFDFSFLKNYLKKFLPAYMIPYDFEIMEQVEATHFQKVDYKTLRQKARQKYLSFRKEKTQGLDSSVISQIKDIWSQHLQKESIDIHQSFFDAGGDSIMAVEIYQSLCERFNVRLDPFVFYKSPTIYKLALAMIETGNKNPSTDEATKIFLSSSSQKKGIYKFSPQQIAFKIVLKFFKLINKIRPYFYQSKNMKTAPQSPQQKYFIYIKQLLGEQYNGCFSVPITGSVDLEQLKKVLDLTIASQESLRTVFHWRQTGYFK